MARFKVYLEYEGTRYRGWQIQKNARTVQGEILHAIQTVFHTTQVEFQGAGRTDAGVHALCQIAHLDVNTMLAPEIIRMKINDELPADINILEVAKAHPSFHARHDALARSYLYQISRRRTALGKRYVWWVKDDVDVRRMQGATSLFTGMLDLQSFTEDDPEEKSTLVQLDRCRVEEHDNLILVHCVGSHFLWKAVRRIVGVLIEVGRGKLSTEDVSQFLGTHSNEPARLTAPPSGLFLEGVYYRGDTTPATIRPTMVIAQPPSGRGQTVRPER